MRIRTGVVRRRKHNKIRKEATKRGFSGHHGRTFRGAREGLIKALKHSYVDRKRKKRTMRQLWITRINAGLREHGLSYSKFMNALTQSSVQVDRHVLSEIAVQDPMTFGKIIEKVQNSAGK